MPQGHKYVDLINHNNELTNKLPSHSTDTQISYLINDLIIGLMYAIINYLIN